MGSDGFPRRARAAWYLPAPDEDAPLQLPEAFNLLGAHTDFFGHWMCEYLPKYRQRRSPAPCHACRC